MAVKTKKSNAAVQRRREEKAARRRKRIETGHRPRRVNMQAKKDAGASAFYRLTQPLFNLSRRRESDRKAEAKAKHKLRKRQEKAGKIPKRDNRTRSTGKRGEASGRRGSRWFGRR